MRPHKLQLLLPGIVMVTCLKAQTSEHDNDYNHKTCNPEEALFYSTVAQTDTGWYRRDCYLRENKLQTTGLYHISISTPPAVPFRMLPV